MKIKPHFITLALLLLIVPTFFMCVAKQQDEVRKEAAVVSNYEIQALANIIYAEASPGDTLDMYLVGSTVLNRVDNKLFPNLIDSVINQKYQYDGSDNIKNNELCVFIATELLKGCNRDTSVLYFINYDSATDTSHINFLKNKKVLTKTTNHYFY